MESLKDHRTIDLQSPKCPASPQYAGYFHLNQFAMNYFLVFYMGRVVNGTSYGSAALVVDAVFLNQANILKLVTESGGFDKCIITNIIPLTKEEYDEWTME